MFGSEDACLENPRSRQLMSLSQGLFSPKLSWKITAVLESAASMQLMKENLETIVVLARSHLIRVPTTVPMSSSLQS